jgi:radical SAM protein with 4Fe4S-binding SPASM domain
MGLDDVRRRLPVVESLPRPKGRRFLPRVVAEAPQPRYAVWEFTLACDHRCLHCGPRAGKARDDELTTEEALRLVDEMAELGVGEVTLIGGEAYLRPDFLLVIRACRERGIDVSMTTGGLGLDPRRCEAAREAGLTTVSVSIDGLQASHDHVRDREGSWAAAFKALRNARAAGLNIASNTQINAMSASELPQLLELLAAEHILAWQVQFTMAHGNAADHPEIMLQPHQLPGVFETLDRLVDRCREHGIVFWPSNNVGYFGPGAVKIRKSTHGGKHWPGCAAGVATMGIESNGMIKGCPSLGGPTNIGGGFREHGLRAIWERAPELRYIRERSTKELWGYCAECYYADVCRAGCTATSEPLLGRPGNNPYCHHRALEMDRQGLRERVEPVRAAPDQPFGQGLFRVVRESKDPTERERSGPVAIEEPRSSRIDEMFGPGRPR